jgi:AcrR family transcriptional regulator
MNLSGLGQNKHQMKSEATRTALLEAAQVIFARDGFERAQIDEIAKESGRTRGAVYAQFKTKEQLFFALQEQQIEQAREELMALTESTGARDTGARLAALRKYYSEELHRESAILDLEMKLYAIRHPETVKELRERYRKSYPKGSASEYFGVHDEPGRSRLSTRILALGALKSGLMLAMAFQPDLLQPKDVQLLLGEIFDGLFPPASNLKPKRKPSKKQPEITEG